MIFNILMGVNIMKGLIISLVVLVVLTVIAIPIYSKDKDKNKGGSNLRVIDATGLVLGKVVGFSDDSGINPFVSTTVGGEIVILLVQPEEIFAGSTPHFKLIDCQGQAYFAGIDSNLGLTGIGRSDNSVYKILDRDPALLESFTVMSLASFGICNNVSFFTTDLLPSTRIRDLTEFTTPFEFSE